MIQIKEFRNQHLDSKTFDKFHPESPEDYREEQKLIFYEIKFLSYENINFQLLILESTPVKDLRNFHLH